MSAPSLWKYVYLAYLAKPASDRVIYRTIRKSRAGHLLVIGLGTGQTPKQMVQLAARYTHRPCVRLTGIDRFETRPAPLPPLSLKTAYRLLNPLVARIQLVPGDPWSALARIANSVCETDLVVIRADQDRASLDRAWYYLPRMLHSRSVVLIEDPAGAGSHPGFRTLDYAAVAQLARQHVPHRRAA